MQAATEAERRYAHEQALASAMIEGYEPTPEFLASISKDGTHLLSRMCTTSKQGGFAYAAAGSGECGYSSCTIFP